MKTAVSFVSGVGYLTITSVLVVTLIVLMDIATYVPKCLFGIDGIFLKCGGL